MLRTQNLFGCPFGKKLYTVLDELSYWGNAVMKTIIAYLIILSAAVWLAKGFADFLIATASL